MLLKVRKQQKSSKEFMKKDEIFLPRKFQEKITPQDIEEQIKIKANLNLMKLKAQTEIPEDKTTHYKTKYQEIDQELITEITELCPIETQQFLIELCEENSKKEKEKSRENCKKEEEKSRKILNEKLQS